MKKLFFVLSILFACGLAQAAAGDLCDVKTSTGAILKDGGVRNANGECVAKIDTMAFALGFR